MNHDVFISYSSKNSTAAQAICHELEDNGIKCWMAPRDIPVGAKYASVITDAIVSSKVVVLIFSNYAACSVWVESEINIAFSNRKIIIPYKIDTTKYEDFKEFYLLLNNRHWIDAYPDFKTRFKELVETVAQTLGKKVSVKNTDDEVDFEHQPSKGILIIKADLDCRVFNYGEEIGIAKAGEYTKFELPLGDNELKYVGLESDEDCYEELVVINENYQKSVSVALFDKYNACRAKEEAERKAREEAERQAYLLGLPDDEFKRFEKNGKYGFKVASMGEIIIPLKYDFAAPFSEGLASVKLNGKWGFIDKTGKEVIPLKYDAAGDFSEGLVDVRLNGILNGKFSFIDKTGKEAIPLKYDDAGSFSEGLAVVRIGSRYGGKYGYIDKTGKEVIPLKYDDACGFSEGLANVKLNGRYGFIDKTSKEVIPLKYDAAGNFSDGLARVKLNGKWGYVDKTGKEVIPLKYDDAWLFSEGLASVKLNGKWGFIDKTGKEVISLKYDYAYPFNGGKATIELNEEWFYIDKNGNRIEE